MLVVEDDAAVRDVVRRYLERDGYRVNVSADGADAVRLAAAQPPDLVVLDLMLPGLPGLDVCRALRSDPRTADVPIVMLTALAGVEDRIAGLELGADDYVTKPFSPRELALRVSSVLRRSHDGNGKHAGAALRTDGDVVLDPVARVVTVGGNNVSLTSREFDLLAFLMAHPGEVHSRSDLLEQVWGWTFGDHSTVTVHVKRLRAKLEPDPGGRARIVTVYGLGYRFDPVDDAVRDDPTAQARR